MRDGPMEVSDLMFGRHYGISKKGSGEKFLPILAFNSKANKRGGRGRRQGDTWKRRLSSKRVSVASLPEKESFVKGVVTERQETS